MGFAQRKPKFPFNEQGRSFDERENQTARVCYSRVCCVRAKVQLPKF